MTTTELKTRIFKAIDNVPENSLPAVLDYLNSIKQNESDEKKLYAFIDRVFEEDREVLKRLAQ